MNLEIILKFVILSFISASMLLLNTKVTHQ